MTRISRFFVNAPSHTPGSHEVSDADPCGGAPASASAPDPRDHMASNRRQLELPACDDNYQRRSKVAPTAQRRWSRLTSRELEEVVENRDQGTGRRQGGHGCQNGAKDLADGRMLSEARQERTWRTRTDPFESVTKIPSRQPSADFGAVILVLGIES